MFFKNLFKSKQKMNLLKRVDDFKALNKDIYLFDDFMIDKNGDYVHFIITYCKYSTGKIHIFTYSKNYEEVIFIVESSELLIADIRIFESKNKGIGSKVISILEHIAVINNCNKLHGSLSNNGYDNRNRQIYFYEKNGFTIRYDEFSSFGGETIYKYI